MLVVNIISAVLSVFAIIISIFAIRQTKTNQSISLFEKRLEYVLFVRDSMNLIDFFEKELGSKSTYNEIINMYQPGGKYFGHSIKETTKELYKKIKGISSSIDFLFKSSEIPNTKRFLQLFEQYLEGMCKEQTTQESSFYDELKGLFHNQNKVFDELKHYVDFSSIKHKKKEKKNEN